MEPWLIACIILDIAVIIANVIQQTIICRKWKMLDRIEHLLLSLSISDLLNGIATLSIDVWFYTREEKKQNGEETYVSDNVIHVILDSVFIFSVFASVLHVIAVAVERLYAVRFPRKYYIFTTRTFKCTTIAVIWIIALVLTPSFSVLSCFSLDTVIGTFIRGTVLAIIEAGVFLVYISIAYFLLSHRKTIMRDFSPNCSLQQEHLKRLTVLCLFIGMSFVVCLLPITISYFSPHLYHHMANVMITLNSFINPCIYFGKVYLDSRTTGRARARTRSDTTQNLLVDRSRGLSMTNDEGELDTPRMGYNHVERSY